jgi:hypothetical protein
MRDHAPSGSEDPSGVGTAIRSTVVRRRRFPERRVAEGRFADRHKTISSPDGVVRRCPRTVVSGLAGLHGFPPAPEGAGFRPHGLLWFPPIPEGIGFRQGGARVSAGSRRGRFPSARVALVSADARRHWFPPGRVQGLPPLSEDAGFHPCGVHRRLLPFKNGGFFLRSASASAFVRRRGFVRRRCLPFAG